jgi:hypothetical protein
MAMDHDVSILSRGSYSAVISTFHHRNFVFLLFRVMCVAMAERDTFVSMHKILEFIHFVFTKIKMNSLFVNILSDDFLHLTKS